MVDKERAQIKKISKKKNMTLFSGVSMTGSGMAILAVMYIAQWLGLDFSQTQAATIVKDAIEAVGFVLSIWGQIRRSDLQYGFWRVK